jgi:hypothetical protein
MKNNSYTGILCQNVFCYYSFQAFGTGNTTTGTNMTTTLFVLRSHSVTQSAQAAELQLLHLTAGELKAIKYAIIQAFTALLMRLFL